MNSITISWLMKAMRPYSNNPTKAYQNMLSDMFGELINNRSYFVESTSSSRIMNNEYDVPSLIRENIAGSEERVLINRLVSYLSDEVNASLVSQLRQKMQSEIDASPLSKEFKDNLFATSNDYEFISIVALCAINTNNRKRYEQTIIDNSKFHVDLISGDLISMSLNKKLCKSFKISVIPVDDNFTMKLSLKGDESPLISKDSLHGKFIGRMDKLGFTSNRIKINTEYIDKSGDFKIGKFTYGQTEFWLVPISHLGKRNKAESSIDVITKALDAIIDEYDIVGQGFPLYMPTLGTGRSRVFKSNEDAIDFITKRISMKSPFISGTIHIVIYKKDVKN